MALGAAGRETLGLILRETVLLGAAGVVIGLPLALAGTRLARSMLFGVGPWDPRLFAIAVLVLAVVLLAAGAIPARRATRIDPLSALRAE
jgi:ABC-type antimicrobial peptide transport system permease subunit